ncbi:hypothetical protein I545_5462 [Mycobacterium kansasii 662]|uniref:Uncharacterized protein n=1 Tax=Mycobacterium kansasii 662 TaxID=1299326 RepID=X7YX21_MYCKA|nr:hypothetical protein I545_5462 [Mycobacterium kansasii 662]KEP42164.1 hypothetical protein MKSMC1_27510 [Mycobacterium kansasii]
MRVRRPGRRRRRVLIECRCRHDACHCRSPAMIPVTSRRLAARPGIGAHRRRCRPA